MTEYRTAPIEVRADGDAKGRVTVTPMPYGTLDAYNTRFRAGCFADFLTRSAPVFAWAHDDAEPIGQMIDFDDTPTRLRMNMQLDDFDAVPRARQAYAQLCPNPVTGKPTLRDVSIGFERHEWGPPDKDDVIDFIRCDLLEVSVVMNGAVPGAIVDGVRKSAPMIPRQNAIDIALQLHRGEINLECALLALHEERVSKGLHVHARQTGGGKVSHSHADGHGMHAHPGLMPTVRDGVVSEQTYSDAPETRDGMSYEDKDSLLRDALAKMYPSPDQYVYTVVTTDTDVAFRVSEGSNAGTYQCSYAIDGAGVVTLGEVKAVVITQTVLPATGQNAAPAHEIKSALDIAARYR